MPRLVGLLLLGLSLVLVAIQNPTPVVPLVVLGQSVAALPLGWWLAGAIGAGAIAMGCVELLVQVGRRAPRPVVDRRAKPSAGPSTSPRQRVLDNSLTEAADEWSEADGPEDRRDSSGKKSWRSRLFSMEAEPRPSAVAADLEEELSGWSAPDRSQKGWNHDPEWDEWEEAQAAAAANAAAANAPRRSPPGERPEQPTRPANRVDRPFDRSANPLGDRADQPRPSGSPAPPTPAAKPIEAPTRPAANQQQGTVYSIRYQRDADSADESSDTDHATDRPTDRPAPARSPEPDSEPDLPPPETRSRAVTDAEYRVLIPPPPEASDPPPRARSDWDKPTTQEDWDDDW
jgi:hypothetical protein